MTNMRRTSVAFPDEIDQEIIKIRKDDRFIRCSYSEIVRHLVILGLEATARHDDEAKNRDSA